MHIDSTSLLTNAALVSVGVLAVTFLVWFLVALSFEKNGAHIRCRMEYKVEPNTSVRKPIRQISASRPALRAAQVLVTHRAAVALIPKYEFTDEPQQAGTLSNSLRF